MLRLIAFEANKRYGFVEEIDGKIAIHFGNDSMIVEYRAGGRNLMPQIISFQGTRR